MVERVEFREPKSIEEIEATALLWTTVFRSLANLTDDDPQRWFKVDTWRQDALDKLAGQKSDQITVLAVDGDEVIGGVTGYKMRASDHLLYAEVAAVKKERRGAHVGKGILKEFIRMCTRMRINTILFDTNTDPAHGGATAVWDSIATDDIGVDKIGEIPGYWNNGTQNGVLYRAQLRGFTW